MFLGLFGRDPTLLRARVYPHIPIHIPHNNQGSALPWRGERDRGARGPVSATAARRSGCGTARGSEWRNEQLDHGRGCG